LRLLTIFTSCLAVLAVLQALANNYAALIPILESLAWPGAVISYGLFSVFGTDFFAHPVALNISELVVNAAMFAAALLLLLKIVRVTTVNRK
jgi:hypothetical protein